VGFGVGVVTLRILVVRNKKSSDKNVGKFGKDVKLNREE
jgi:hypothetical protein